MEIINDYVLLITYAPYISDEEYEEWRHVDEPPLATIAVRKDFLAKFVEEETNCDSVDEFLNEYIYDDIADLHELAEKAGALAFIYRQHMEPEFTFPVTMSGEAAAALLEFEQERPLFDVIRRRLPDSVNSGYASFDGGILTPTVDDAVSLLNLLAAASETTIAVPTDDGERGMVIWNGQHDQPEKSAPDDGEPDPKEDE